ncbi:MAG: hypothetical protein FWH22_09825 [Fibromonadales bacterium]|nr:hypothetical protein [Fibromonadales bacterium]
MRTLQVTMPEIEYARLGIQNDILDFFELERLIERDKLNKTQDRYIIKEASMPSNSFMDFYGVFKDNPIPDKLELRKEFHEKNSR